jgi:hypothetical protein
VSIISNSFVDPRSDTSSVPKQCEGLVNRLASGVHNSS